VGKLQNMTEAQIGKGQIQVDKPVDYLKLTIGEGQIPVGTIRAGENVRFYTMYGAVSDWKVITTWIGPNQGFASLRCVDGRVDDTMGIGSVPAHVGDMRIENGDTIARQLQWKKMLEARST